MARWLPGMCILNGQRACDEVPVRSSFHLFRRGTGRSGWPENTATTFALSLPFLPLTRAQGSHTDRKGPSAASPVLHLMLTYDSESHKIQVSTHGDAAHLSPLTHSHPIIPPKSNHSTCTPPWANVRPPTWSLPTRTAMSSLTTHHARNHNRCKTICPLWHPPHSLVDPLQRQQTRTSSLHANDTMLVSLSNS